MNINEHYAPVCFSENIRIGSKLSVSLNDEPIILLRTPKALVAYRDYCPHRGAPLSKGRIVNNQIHCPYHGWAFDCENGENTNVPVKNERVSCKLFSVQVKEKHGLVWLCKQENALFPEMPVHKSHIKFRGIIKAQLANILENFLEGSHTHYVHNGIVRSENKKRSFVKARFIPNSAGFEVHYEVEKQKGLVTRLTPKRFRELTTVSKYVYPYTAILQYFDKNKVLVAEFKGILKPEKEQTEYFAGIYLNLGFFTPIAKIFGAYLFKKIVNQDKDILELQQQNLSKHSENNFYSDDNTDTVGKQIFAWNYRPDKILTEEKNIILYV